VEAVRERAGRAVIGVGAVIDNEGIHRATDAELRAQHVHAFDTQLQQTDVDRSVAGVRQHLHLAARGLVGGCGLVGGLGEGNAWPSQHG
jgi:hypothetical protein